MKSLANNLQGMPVVLADLFRRLIIKWTASSVLERLANELELAQDY